MISLGLLLVVGLVVLGGANEALSLIRSDQKTVEVPQVAGEKKERGTTYSLNPTDYATSDGTLVFRLQSRSRSSGAVPYAEGYSLDTRNLLFFKEGAGKVLWLFPDQARLLVRVEGYKSGSSQEDVLLIEAEPDRRQEENGGSLNSRDLYLVHMDGTGVQRILTGVEQTLHRKAFQGQLQIVYQNADAVRLARFSLKDFRLLSDGEVAKIESLKK